MARQDDDHHDTPVLEEAAAAAQTNVGGDAAGEDTNNRGNFTRNLNKEADDKIARKMFFGGMVFLPWLHLVNVIFFRKQFMDPTVDSSVTLWVRRSFMGFCFWSVLFLAWVLLFQLNWRDFGWSNLVMDLPDEDLDVGW